MSFPNNFSSPRHQPDMDKESWKSWLDRNERETWQMELLVVGFAIYLLVYSFDPLREFYAGLRFNMLGSSIGEPISFIFGVVLLTGWYVTLANLIFSVSLRSLWIASIGVRSFSGEIKLDDLNFSPKFNQFLKRRLPEFDEYIISLERLCSSIFALTFLLVFTILGSSLLLGIFGVLMALFAEVLSVVIKKENESIVFVVVWLWLILSFAPLVLYAIDFISGSSIKRSKGFEKIYYPIYRLLGWCTGARLYRPLYYNLIDHEFGRKAVALSIPYFVIILSITRVTGSSFTPLLPRGDVYGVGKATYYADNDEVQFSSLPYINAKVIEKSYIEIYIPLSDAYYTSLTSCDSLARLYISRAAKASNLDKSEKYLAELLTCISSYIEVSIDDKPLQNLEYSLISSTEDENDPYLLYTIQAVDSLKSGKHVLHFQRLNSKGKRRLVSSIPFFIP